MAKNCWLCAKPLMEYTDELSGEGTGWTYCIHCDDICADRETPKGCKFCAAIIGEGKGFPPEPEPA